MFKAGVGKVGEVKPRRKVATTKDRLDKKIVTLGLHNSLPVVTINKIVIAKLEEDSMI